jgi:type IV secretory pathway VirD2 relaxase
MSEVFNLSLGTMKAIDKLYDDRVVDSKELFVELGIAIGMTKGMKEKLDDPKPFHTLEEVDKGHVYSIIASTRNLELVTEEQVTRELEMYAEAGIKDLMENAIKDNKLNYYHVLKRYSEA